MTINDEDATLTGDGCRLLTIDAAADFLAIGRGAVYHLLDRGEMASIHIGRSRRIALARVAAFRHQVWARAHDCGALTTRERCVRYDGSTGGKRVATNNVNLRRADSAAHEESVASLVDEAESVPEVEPFGDRVAVGDFQHDRHGCLLGTSLNFSHECVARCRGAVRWRRRRGPTGARSCRRLGVLATPNLRGDSVYETSVR